MTQQSSPYDTAPIEPADTGAGFSSGKHPLDDYFARHAIANDATGVGRAYVLRRGPDDDAALPDILGVYTLSMASVESAQVSEVLKRKLPKYPMPVALIGRLAVDQRAQRRGLGERLLMDALRRVLDAANLVGCLGIIVDAKDEAAQGFYERYDFATVTSADWPRRMFLALGTARAAFGG